MMDARRGIRRRAYLGLLTVACMVSISFAAAYVSHLRWDATEDQIYTLSASTHAVLNQLDEPIQIRAYITSGMPQPYGRMHRFLGDMLRAYHDAGHGQVGFEVIDPSTNPNIAASLDVLKIPQIQVQVVEDDRAQIKQGYMAIVIEYLDKKEVIPIVKNEQGFEYVLTRKIKHLTGKGRQKIGIVTGFGARTATLLSNFRSLIVDDYTLVEVHPDTQPVSDDLRALIIAGFNQPPSQAMRYGLDQFRMSGRGMLILAGNASPQLKLGFKVKTIDAKAQTWLRDDFGIAVESGLIMDPVASRVTVNHPQGRLMFRSVVDYPFLPSVEDMAMHHPVTQNLAAISVPFASPLAWADDTNGILLMRSSPMAAVQDGSAFDVNPMIPMKQRFAGLTRRQVNIALALQGAAHSAFKKAPVAKNKFLAQTKAQRVIVIGSPAMLDNEFMSGSNLVFALNALDWLAGDEQLISLRSRNVTDRPLLTLNSDARQAWKAIWMFALPLLVVMAGVWRWRRLKQMG